MSVRSLPLGMEPCPFCGGDKLRGAGAKSRRGVPHYIYRIICNCGVELKSTSKESAIAAWNARRAG